MSAPTLNRPGIAPLLSVFAVRAEVEPVADVRDFDQEVDAAIEQADRTGSLEQLRSALFVWLGIALQAKHADQHVHLPRGERAANRDRLIRNWMAEHPGAVH